VGRAPLLLCSSHRGDEHRHRQLRRVLDPLERPLDVDRAHRGEEEADRADVRRAVGERRRVDVAGGVGGGIGVEDAGHHVERGGGVEREQQRLHRREEDEALFLQRQLPQLAPPV